MFNTGGSGGFFGRKIADSGQQNQSEDDTNSSSWDGLWGENVYNRDEHGRRKKKKRGKNKIPIYPIGPMFGSMLLIDDVKEEGGLANANGNGENRNQSGPSPLVSSNNHNVAGLANPNSRSNGKPNAPIEPPRIGARASETNGMANSTENCSSISASEPFRWSESDASPSPRTHRSTTFSTRSNENQNNQNGRWVDSGSPHPPVSRSIRSTLSRPLPHILGTNPSMAKGVNGKKNHWTAGRNRFEYQYSSSESEDESQNLASNISGNIRQQNSSLPNAAEYGNGNHFDAPSANPCPNSSMLPNHQRTLQRENSLLSLETGHSDFGTTDSSFTIISDPHISQYVQERRANIFDENEIDYEDETTGLEDLVENEPQEGIPHPPISSSSSSITPIPPQSYSSRPAFSISNASIQTGSTLTTQQIPLTNRPLINPLSLANERQALQELAQKMGLQFEVRQDEGAVAFSQPANHRILVLNSAIYGDQTVGHFEGIRVSLHTNGRIYRETYLLPVEKWLGHAAIEGLCRRFFVNGQV